MGGPSPTVPFPLLGPTHTTPSSQVPTPPPLEKNWTWGWGGEPARGGPFSVALDGGGTAGVPPPIPPPSKLMTTPKSVFEPPRSLGTPGESLVMILATSGINGNSHEKKNKNNKTNNKQTKTKGGHVGWLSVRCLSPNPVI